MDMENLVLVLGFLILTFTVLFLLNLFFRVKVIKSYRKLSKNGVEFESSAIFSAPKMKEVILTYPEYEADLLQFSKYLRYTVLMASVFIVITIIFGSVLMYTR